MDEKKLRYIRRPSFSKKHVSNTNSLQESIIDGHDHQTADLQRTESFRSSFLIYVHELNFQKVGQYLDSQEEYQLFERNIRIDLRDFPRSELMLQHLSNTKRKRFLDVSAVCVILLSEFSTDIKEVLLLSIKDKLGHLMIPCDSDGRTPIIIASALNDLDCVKIILMDLTHENRPPIKNSCSSSKVTTDFLQKIEDIECPNELQNSTSIELFSGVYEIIPDRNTARMETMEYQNDAPCNFSLHNSPKSAEEIHNFSDQGESSILDVCSESNCGTSHGGKNEMLGVRIKEKFLTVLPLEICRQNTQDQSRIVREADDHNIVFNFSKEINSYSDGQGWNYMHYASFNHSYNCIEYYFSNIYKEILKGCLRSTDFRGENCLHLLMHHKIYESMNYPLEIDGQLLFNIFQPHEKSTLSSFLCTYFAKRMIECGVDINAQSSMKQTALHLAIKSGCANCVQLLIECGASLNLSDEYGRYPIHLAVIHSNRIKACDEVNNRIYEEVIMHFALGSGTKDTEGLRNRKFEIGACSHAILDDLVVQTSSNRNESDQGQGNVESRNDNRAYYCLNEEMGASWQLKSIDKSPVQCRILDLLLKDESSINNKDIEDKTAIHYAGLHYDFDVLKRILNARCNLNEQDKNGKTLLHYLSCNKVDDLRGWSLLLHDYGADPNIRDSKGRTCMHEMFSWESKENVEFVEGQVRKVSRLFDLLDSGKIKPKYNVPDFEGLTIVHQCLRKVGSIESYSIIGRLFSKGCNLNTPEYVSGMTPLAYALNSCEIEQNIGGLFKLYPHLSRERVDTLGKSLLHHAARNGSLRDVKDLVSLNMNINARDALGRTPLQEAIISIKDEKGVEKTLFLIEAGSDVNNKDNLGISTIHDVCSLTYKDNSISAINVIIQELLKKGANLDSQDFRGRTPLHIVASSNSLFVCDQLIKNQASISVVDMKNRTALHEAVRNGSEEIVMHLIERGCEIEKCDFDGNSILHEAAGRNLDESIIQKLLSSKKIVRLMMRTRNMSGNTPLLCSLNNPHFKISRMFISHDLTEAKDLEPAIEFLNQRKKFSSNIIPTIGRKLLELGIIGKNDKDYIGIRDLQAAEARSKFDDMLQSFEVLSLFTEIEKEWDFNNPFDIEAEESNINHCFGNLRRMTHKIVSEMRFQKRKSNLVEKIELEWVNSKKMLCALISTVEENIHYITRKLKMIKKMENETIIAAKNLPHEITGLVEENSLIDSLEISMSAINGCSEKVKSLSLLEDLGKALLAIYTSFFDFNSTSTLNFQREKFSSLFSVNSSEFQHKLLERKLLKQESKIWKEFKQIMNQMLSRMSLLNIFGKIRYNRRRIRDMLENQMKIREVYQQNLKEVESVFLKRMECNNVINMVLIQEKGILAARTKKIKIKAEIKVSIIEGRPKNEVDLLENQLNYQIKDIKGLKIESEVNWSLLLKWLPSKVTFGELKIYDTCDLFWRDDTRGIVFSRMEQLESNMSSLDVDSFLKLSQSSFELYIPPDDVFETPALSFETYRRLWDYENKKVLTGNLIEASLNGEKCVLKYHHLDNKDQRESFTNEIKILSKVKHPAVIKMEGHFVDFKIGFIHFKSIVKKDIGQWIQMKSRSLLEIRHVFQRILNGIVYLHEHDIVHRKINLQSIIFDEGESPIICHFENAVDISRVQPYHSTYNISIFSAPESHLNPDIVSQKLDIWSFGVLMLYAHHPQLKLETLVLESENFQIPKHENEALQIILKRMLNSDPMNRPTGIEVLDSSYFTSDKFFKKTKQLWDTSSKMSIFRNHVSGMRNHKLKEGRKIEVVISRENIVDEVIHAFASLHVEQLLYPIKVKFRGEHGQDMVHTLAGGLTAEMYTLFFESLLSPKSRLFESAPEGESPAVPTYIPKAGYINDPWGYFVIGMILTKCLIDGVTAPITFPSFMFKYLLGNEVMNLEDLEQYNWQLARGLRQVLLTPNIQEVLPYTFGGLATGGEDVEVTDDNKQHFVELKANHSIYHCREKQLQALRNGFFSVSEVSAVLAIFNHHELQMLCCGEEHIDAEMVIANMVFSPAEDDPRWEVYETELGFKSTTAKDLIKIIQGYDRESLRRFIRFATAKVRIPEGGFDPKIRVMRCPTSNQYPKGHCCFHSIALPDYKCFKILEEKLKEALHSEGFGIE